MNEKPIKKETDEFVCWHNSHGLHREGGLPAKIWKDGMMIYMIDGKLHREDGPAIVNPKNKMTMFFLNGVEVTDKKEMRKILLRGRFKKLNSPQSSFGPYLFAALHPLFFS